MDPVTGSLIGGLAGDFLGGIFGNSAQKKANKANVRLQREQQAWEERMANSAYQRATKDLASAGLNPMLAYSQGGATTPSVSAATVQPVDAMARSIGTASNKAFQALQLHNMELQNRILQEKGQQEIVTTHVMQQENPPMGDQSKSKWRLAYNKLDAETRRELANADIAEIEREIAQQVKGFKINSARDQAAILSKEVTGQELKNQLMHLDIPEKEAMAKWFETVGAASPAMKATMSIANWIKFILGR